MSFKRLLRSGTGPTGSTSHFTACKPGPSNSVQSFMLSRASCCCNVVRNEAQPAGLICQQLKTLKTINKSVLYNIIYGKNMINSQTMNTCDLHGWLIQYLYCNCFEYLKKKKRELPCWSIQNDESEWTLCKTCCHFEFSLWPEETGTFDNLVICGEPTLFSEPLKMLVGGKYAMLLPSRPGHHSCHWC